MDSATLKTFIDKIITEGKDYMNLPSKESIKNIDWSNITSIITTIGTILILLIVSAFALWLIRAIGLYVMAKKKGDDLAFLAFIPYACLFVTGRIVGKTKLFGIEITYPEYVLPLILISMMFPYVGVLASLLFVVFYYGLLYRLYQQRWRGFATVATILSFFLPILQPLFLFFIRNN